MRLRIVLAALVATIATMVLNPGLAAYAKQVFTGDNIIDGSLTGADIQNGSLQSADLAPGAGGGGGESDQTLHEWTYAHAANGDNSLNTTTAQTVPPGTLIESVDLTLTGLTNSNCPNGYVAVTVGGSANIASVNISPDRADETLTVAATGVDSAKPLTLLAYCQDNNGNFIPLPTFTLTYVFAQSASAAGTPAAFN